ncbi:MAG TPA: hypothetical protein VFN21_13035 [Acidimicrobiales bacterium]|nr:hypothetical protein [Acidimicrobiales bacterium]
MSASTDASRADPRLAEAPSTTGADAPRWVGLLVIAVAILPIWVAAIRDGLRGVFPASDAAATVIRARDVFGGPFPLVGMPAAAATTDGYQSFFPGAWQLYVLAVPTQLFGNVWGPPVAMALLNSVWVALAVWLLLRRLRLAEAFVGIALFAALSWSTGSVFLVTPVPMDMIIIPTALFLLAVWSVADGDLAAVPVLAVVANFLWLDHLVLVVTVPLVGLCAPIGLWLWTRRMRREDPDGRPERSRRINRSLIAAGAITVVMWIPTVIQQLTTSPGNLRVLFASAGTDRPSVGSWDAALHNVSSVVVRPPFWLRGTLDSPPFIARPLGGKVLGDLALVDVVVGTLVVVAMVALLVAASRRDDRTGLWLLIVSGTALVAGTISAQSAPSYFGPPTGYLRSLWPTAMFVWFAVLVNVIRLVRPRATWPIIAPCAALALVLTVLNLPSVHGEGEQRLQEVVKVAGDAVVPRLDRGETVKLVTASEFDSHTFGAALALKMSEAGVPYCIPSSELSSNGGRLRPCPAGVRRVVEVVVTSDPMRATKGDVVVREALLDTSDSAELERSKRAIDGWLGSHDHLTLTDEAEHRLASWLTAAQQRQVQELLRPPDGDTTPLASDEVFHGIVRLWYVVHSRESPGLFEDSPLTADEWRRWLNLSERDRTLIVTERHRD